MPKEQEALEIDNQESTFAEFKWIYIPWEGILWDAEDEQGDGNGDGEDAVAEGLDLFGATLDAARLRWLRHSFQFLHPHWQAEHSPIALAT